MFLHFYEFFHFLSFSFMFFHVLSFSFIFFHFRSFSIIFFHFLTFSFIFFVFVGCSKSDFLGLNFVTISVDSSYVKSIFGPISGGTSLGRPLFLFFPLFSSPVFCLVSCFFIFHFSHFWFISSFL